MKKLTIQQAIDQGYTHFHFSHKIPMDRMPINEAFNHIDNKDIELILSHKEPTKTNPVSDDDITEFIDDVVFKSTCDSAHFGIVRDLVKDKFEADFEYFKKKFNDIASQKKYYESTNIMLVL